ncbi:rhomboid family intramembrane serine protease [Halorarum halobium]|uniref:rhomboid family intramembrane serine protease n=1 Tax=Halorarum halobium TaxID=3075121 RepID=UPI0028A76AAA|nr:rhomboid family intramembrane serine protease [Halobaculum sp. XH14]
MTDDDSTGRRWLTLAGNPVIETLAAMCLVSLMTWAGALVGLAGLFVLSESFVSRPWVLLTSVYAHASPGHLLANAVVVALAGSLVARNTTRFRFHAFFVTTGALAGLAQVWLGGLLGPSAGVLGASGAAFALAGYVLAANPVSTGLLDRIGLSTRVAAAVVALVAAGLTLAFSAVGSALVAHFTGRCSGWSRDGSGCCVREFLLAGGAKRNPQVNASGSFWCGLVDQW